MNGADEIYRRLFRQLSVSEFEEITEAAELSNLVTGDSPQISILRFIVTKAQRTKTTPESVIDLLIKKDSASVILGDLATINP